MLVWRDFLFYKTKTVIENARLHTRAATESLPEQSGGPVPVLSPLPPQQSSCLTSGPGQAQLSGWQTRAAAAAEPFSSRGKRCSLSPHLPFMLTPSLLSFCFHPSSSHFTTSFSSSSFEFLLSHMVGPVSCCNALAALPPSCPPIKQELC